MNAVRAIRETKRYNGASAAKSETPEKGYRPKVDSRERTFRALSFEEPDRVPTDLWLSKGFREKMGCAGKAVNPEFLDAHDIDLRYIDGPAYIGPPLRTFDDGTEEDIWGVRRRTITVPTSGGAEDYKEVALSPLESAATIAGVEAYAHWPSPDWFDYGTIESQCAAIRGKGRVVVFMGDRLNRLAQLKPAMYLRGISQIFIDMMAEPDIAEAVFARIRAFYMAYAERIFEAANGKIDILLTGDDFGAQNGPLISPDSWTQFIEQGFAAYIALAKAHDIRVMHHTCGSVLPLIPKMIRCGLDVLQSLQPEAAGMEPAQLKADYGGRLAFHGGISIQNTLPFGTPGDVRGNVRRVIQALAPGGGYILCTSHNIQADTPIENLQALLDAYAEFGGYA